jgi:hypothetical protein
MRIDDRVGEETFRAQVIGPHLVAGRITSRDVLDQEQRPSLGRDGVEAEVAMKRDEIAKPQTLRVEDLERVATVGGENCGAMGSCRARSTGESYRPFRAFLRSSGTLDLDTTMPRPGRSAT